MEYEADVDNVRTETARKRMPWAVYREAVTQLLPESTGLFELLMLMALCRETGDSAARWLQRCFEHRQGAGREDGSEASGEAIHRSCDQILHPVGIEGNGEGPDS